MYRPCSFTSDIDKREPLILGIESSCDETAAAVIRGRKILSDEIASSASVQSLYGGVVPRDRLARAYGRGRGSGGKRGEKRGRVV